MSEVPQSPPGSIARLLVALPNWVGDVVLATPVLAALREQLPDARITFLLRHHLREIIDGCGWHDYDISWPKQRGMREMVELRSLVARLRAERFDAALLLPNSFKSAFVVWAARIPVRVGYARDARGWMLTVPLRPQKRDGDYLPVPMLPYYEQIAVRGAGVRVSDRRMRLGITADQARKGRELQQHYGLIDRPYAIINPGAAFGASKCWLPERFAEICDRLSTESGLTPVIVGAPNEAPLMQKIAHLCKVPPVCCVSPGTSLGTLKVLVRDARLMVCNDTGPRHYGVAFGIPVVTIFGPTNQEWTRTGYPREIALQASVPCGPCQLKTCPIDLRCMLAVGEGDVFDACRSALSLPVAC